MPDPNWTAQYQTSQPPEGNGFTRTLYGEGVTVNAITGGSPAGRRLEVTETDAGSGATFTTSAIPALDSLTGATGEFAVSISGAGNAGFEFTFLDRVFGINVYANHIRIDLPADPPNDNQPSATIATPSNAAMTTFRFTVDGLRALRVYRAGTLVAGPLTLQPAIKPFQRVLFWGEGGGTQSFTGMRFYLGGAVAPG